MTLIEVLTVLAIIAVLLVMLLLPALSRAKARSSRVGCISMLKQISLGFRGFAQDWDGLYPFQAPNLTNHIATGAGGTLVTSNTTPADVWMLFQMLSNELATAKLLVCPHDRDRVRRTADDFGAQTAPLGFAAMNARNHSLSYFYGTAAVETRPETILTGDRNLGLAPLQPAYSSAIQGGAVKVNLQSAWSQASSNLQHSNGGNLAFADGSVQTRNDLQLQKDLEMAETLYGSNANFFLFPQ